MSIAKKGIKFTQIHKEAITASRQTSYNKEKSIKSRVKKPMIVWNKSKQFYVLSIKKFCDDYGLSRPFMTRIALGHKAIHKGEWGCRFALEQERQPIPSGLYYTTFTIFKPYLLAFDGSHQLY